MDEITDQDRLNWLANRLLYCDYGDNSAPGEQIGWGVMPKVGTAQFMYGSSINAAIDAEIVKERGAK